MFGRRRVFGVRVVFVVNGAQFLFKAFRNRLFDEIAGFVNRVDVHHVHLIRQIVFLRQRNGAGDESFIQRLVRQIRFPHIKVRFGQSRFFAVLNVFDHIQNLFDAVLLERVPAVEQIGIAACLVQTFRVRIVHDEVNRGGKVAVARQNGLFRNVDKGKHIRILVQNDKVRIVTFFDLTTNIINVD